MTTLKEEILTQRTEVVAVTENSVGRGLVVFTKNGLVYTGFVDSAKNMVLHKVDTKMSK